MSTVQKKYGLILKKPVVSEKPTVKPVAAAFADEEDDAANEASSSTRISASTMRVQAQARREHERALAEDPTIFDYDAIFDELQAKKNEKIAEVKAADKQRKSKYAEQILEAHKKRLLAQQSREERKQQKEREAEAGEFDDKEKFVTSAYRQQLIEMEKFRQQEAVGNRLDELTAVEKQKSGMWKGGFYRTLLNDIARDGDAIKTEKKEIKQEIEDPDDTESIKTTTSRDHAKKLSALRKSSEKDDMLPALPSCSSPKKKSIYSDASDDEPEISNEGPVQLKPGLNILKQRLKKPTKAEQIRRRFTPSPEDSGDSDERARGKSDKRSGRKRERSHDRGASKKRRRSDSHEEKRSEKHRDGENCKRRSSERRRKDRGVSDEKSKKERKESVNKIVKEKTKEERLEIIKKILAHRNGSEKIEEMRERYLERKANNTVPLPL